MAFFALQQKLPESAGNLLESFGPKGTPENVKDCFWRLAIPLKS
jgi:hypothetical protein